MRIKLVAHGNSLAVLIPKPVLELLEIKPKVGTEFEMSTNGKNLVLTPLREEKCEKST